MGFGEFGFGFGFEVMGLRVGAYCRSLGFGFIEVMRVSKRPSPHKTKSTNNNSSSSNEKGNYDLLLRVYTSQPSKSCTSRRSRNTRMLRTKRRNVLSPPLPPHMPLTNIALSARLTT